MFCKQNIACIRISNMNGFLRFFDVVVFNVRILIRILEEVGVIAEPQESGSGRNEGHVDPETFFNDVTVVVENKSKKF